MAWTSYLNNTYWQADSGEEPCTATWNGSAWVACEYAAANWYWCYLKVTGSWMTGYRPTKIRVTWTGGGTFEELKLEAPNGTLVVNESAATSGTEYDIDPMGDDIYSLWLSDQGGGAFTVTNIEFWTDDPTTTTTTTTTTTAPEAPIVDLPGSQGPSGGEFGTVNEGFGGFGFGWG